MSAGRRSAAQQNATLKPATFEVRHEISSNFSAFCLANAAPMQQNHSVSGSDYPAARNLIRGRPSISVRQQTGNRNEWPLSGRLTLPGNGEDGRKPDPPICTPFYAIALPPVEGTLHTPRIARRSVLRATREHGHRRASEPVTKGSTEQQHGSENRRPNYAVAACPLRHTRSACSELFSRGRKTYAQYGR
jgi:hypothetical protein